MRCGIHTYAGFCTTKMHILFILLHLSREETLEHFLFLFSNSLTNLVRAHLHICELPAPSHLLLASISLWKTLSWETFSTLRSLLHQPLYIWREVGGTTWRCHRKLQIVCNKKPNHLIVTAADRHTAHLFPLGSFGWTAIYERRQLLQLMFWNSRLITLKFYLGLCNIGKISHCVFPHFHRMLPNYITLLKGI